VGIKTSTEWSESHYDDGSHVYASLSRAYDPDDQAELVVDGKRIRLNAASPRDLSDAARLIAGQLDEHYA
jgi:hypothetical protein